MGVAFTVTVTVLSEIQFVLLLRTVNVIWPVPAFGQETFTSVPF